MPIVEALVVLSINVHRIDCSIFGQPPPEVEMLAHKNIPGLGRPWHLKRNLLHCAVEMFIEIVPNT